LTKHFERRDVITMTSECHVISSVTSPIDCLHDVITDVITSGSTICVDPLDAQYRRPLC